jgi:transcriptional regulator with PAS, ATPase and Fis domain
LAICHYFAIQLLRVIQAREVERLGGLHPVRIDVRIVAATTETSKKRSKKAFSVRISITG